MPSNVTISHQLSEKPRRYRMTCQAKGLDLYEAKTTVENEKDMEKAVMRLLELAAMA